MDIIAIPAEPDGEHGLGWICECGRHNDRAFAVSVRCPISSCNMMVADAWERILVVVECHDLYSHEEKETSVFHMESPSLDRPSMGSPSMDSPFMDSPFVDFDL